MISIEIHLQRLEWLKEWMALKIDGRLPSMIQVNMEALFGPAMSMDEIIKVFRQTGVMYYRGTEPQISSNYIPMDFDQYCKTKTA